MAKSHRQNCRTGEDEFIEDPEDLRDYVPQDEKTLALYEQCIADGLTPMEAFVKCIEALYGGPPPKKEKL